MSRGTRVLDRIVGVSRSRFTHHVNIDIESSNCEHIRRLAIIGIHGRTPYDSCRLHFCWTLNLQWL